MPQSIEPTSAKIMRWLGLKAPTPSTSGQKIQYPTEDTRPAWKKALSTALVDVPTGILQGIFGAGYPEEPEKRTTGDWIAGGTELLTAGLPFLAYAKKMSLPQIYHGTQRVFNKFDPSRYDEADVLGWMTHFAEDPAYAESYATGAAKHGASNRQVIIPAQPQAQNVLDLVDPNPDDIATVIASLPKYEREEMIRIWKGAHARLPGTGVGHYIKSSHVPSGGIPVGELPARAVAEKLRLTPEQFRQLPFDAIRYRDVGKKSWAIPAETPILSAYGKAPLNEPPKPIKVIRTEEGHGGQLIPEEKRYFSDLWARYQRGDISKEELSELYSMHPESIANKATTKLAAPEPPGNYAIHYDDKLKSYVIKNKETGNIVYKADGYGDALNTVKKYNKGEYTEPMGMEYEPEGSELDKITAELKAEATKHPDWGMKEPTLWVDPDKPGWQAITYDPTPPENFPKEWIPYNASAYLEDFPNEAAGLTGHLKDYYGWEPTGYSIVQKGKKFILQDAFGNEVASGEDLNWVKSIYKHLEPVENKPGIKMPGKTDTAEMTAVKSFFDISDDVWENLSWEDKLSYVKEANTLNPKEFKAFKVDFGLNPSESTVGKKLPWEQEELAIFGKSKLTVQQKNDFYISLMQKGLDPAKAGDVLNLFIDSGLDPKAPVKAFGATVSSAGSLYGQLIAGGETPEAALKFVTDFVAQTK